MNRFYQWCMYRIAGLAVSIYLKASKAAMRSADDAHRDAFSYKSSRFCGEAIREIERHQEMAYAAGSSHDVNDKLRRYRVEIMDLRDRLETLHASKPVYESSELDHSCPQ